MSGEELSAGTPRDPDWSPDVLADLQAGVLDEETAGRIGPAARADPEAVAILTALENTRTELADRPAFEIPEEVAAGIETRLAAEPLPAPTAEREERDEPAVAPERAHPTPDPTGLEQSPPDNVTPIGRAGGRGGRRRSRAFALGAALVAAAAVLLAVVLVPDRTPRETPRAENTAPAAPPGDELPLALTGERVELDGEQLRSVLSSEQYVDSLLDPQRLLACLRANGIENGSPLGAREISLNGRRAQLLVLSTGELGRFRLLAVGPECGPGDPATLSDTVVGG